MNPDFQTGLREAISARSGRVRGRILTLAVILSLFAIGVVLLRRESSEGRAVPVGELKTNGEHWVIFRFDAPKARAVSIGTVSVIGSNGTPEPTYPFIQDKHNVVLSVPDSGVPIYGFVKAGKSKVFKVRHAGGGEWRIQLCLMVHLGFLKQYTARIKGCWRAKSLKVSIPDYVEKNYRIIESKTVRTIDAGIPDPDPPPWSPADELFSLR